MSAVFCPTTVSLLRVLAEQAIQYGRDSGIPALDVFQGHVAGAFHDRDNPSSDPRIKRTVAFALDSLWNSTTPLDPIERLETSLGRHGVGWFMLNLDQAKEINDLDLEKLPYPEEIALQLIKNGALIGDKIVTFSSRPYQDYKPSSMNSGIALIRGNEIIEAFTLIRASDVD